MKELINYSALSKMLTGNRNSIRSNYCVKAHVKEVARLERAVRRWHDSLQDKAL
jgi:hypothetical protein